MRVAGDSKLGVLLNQALRASKTGLQNGIRSAITRGCRLKIT